MDTLCIQKKEKEKEKQKENKNKNISKKFIPPTLEEINSYIIDKSLNVDGKFFFDYFTIGKWIDSKGNKVKNWKQKLLTWDKHNITKQVIKKQTNYNNSNTRQYDNLDNLYANRK